MSKLQQLLQNRNHKAMSLKDIVETASSAKRPMDANEIALFDKLTVEIESLDVQVKAEQDTADRVAKLNAVADHLNAPQGRQTLPDPVNATGARVVASVDRIPARARTRTMKAFKGQDAERRAYRAGMWARAALLGDEKAVNYCVNNGVGGDIRNALGTNINSTGGFLIPEEFSDTIIDLREQYGVFRANTYVAPMGRDTMVVPRRTGGVTIGPIGENPSSAISQSTPTWNQVRLTAKKAGGLVLMSTEVAEDAVIDLAEYLADEFAYAFALYEDQCGFIGDGTSTYLGIKGLTWLFNPANATLIGGVDAATDHDTFAEVDYADLSRLMGRLPEYAKMNAAWYCSSVAKEIVFGRLKATAGGTSGKELEGRQEDTYLGYPIRVSQVLPTSTSDLSNLPMLFFGDLAKCSTFGDRRDVRVFPSEHRYMDTDQIGIRGTMRFDIVNHDVGDASVAGPMVALIGE